MLRMLCHLIAYVVLAGYYASHSGNPVDVTAVAAYLLLAILVLAHYLIEDDESE